MASQEHLRREVHPPGDLFPCHFQAVNGLVLQSNEDGRERKREIL
jgi:hypothetical protein